MVGLRLILLAACCGLTASACVRRPPQVHVAQNAPTDAPLAADSTAISELERMLEPCRQKALQSYRDAQTRFRAGLPERHTMFVVTRLRDPAGRREQVFVAVDRLDGDRITGRVWNDLQLVQGYQRGQTITLPESEMVDWMISRPDGTEEGNWMGRFIDALQATGSPPTGICDP